MPRISIKIDRDGATPAVRRIAALFADDTLRPHLFQDFAQSAATLTRTHVLNNGTNKQNWPSTGFYRAVAQSGISTAITGTGFIILIDHPEKHGAMRQRFYGGTINMNDKLLTIPARQEFYGHRAGEFTNLRFGMLGRGGAKFLYIGEGGTTKVNFQTGTEHRVRGAGIRAAMMIAYWLKESVYQEPDASVIPSKQDYLDNVRGRLAHNIDRAIKNN